MYADEACASISDATGALQCYSNSLQVWDRTGQLMPGGTLQGGDLSATQGALLLRHPGQNQLYDLFTLGATGTASFGILRRSIVDMSLRGGLGDVVLPNSVPVATPNGNEVTEKLTAVLHANGRDYWIVAHGWDNNLFYSYLLGPGGLAAAPVVSAVGSVHTGSGAGGSNSIGYLRASPNGRLLAAAQVSKGIELFSFDAATGRVSAPQVVPHVTSFYYGLEFSPDNSKLYTTNGGQAFQLDLAAGFARTALPVLVGGAMALQRGPDGQIYLSEYVTGSIAIIHQPNAPGLACNLEDKAFGLAGGVCAIGLPNFPNAFATTTVPPSPPVINALAPVCEGELLAVSTPTVLPAGAAFNWNFGDPASGAANTATGPTASHRYVSSGTYKITLTLTTPTGSASTEASAVINALPRFSLGARQQSLCPGSTLTLSVSSPPAGVTYRWQDGSRNTTYLVRAPGRYVLQLVSPQGCASRDSVEVVAAIAPLVTLGRDTVLCEAGPSLILRPNQQPAGNTYLWSDGTTAATYVVRQPGNYWLEVRNSAGCVARASIRVSPGSSSTGCPRVVVPVVIIPTIITPNDDLKNDFFVLEGLVAADWEIAVYNRWGSPVFQQARYDNRWNGNGQPAGTYFYLLTHTVSKKMLRGWVEIVK
ncbi:gliding motility-associated C-terminal domain-containing protein [Hymenobacter sp. UYCo722]|uniref:T9SS type B sorting domain-containing protein n=1 Tax=Hymenobacter sp. UYCo722 TaxID=3156335 RepID=UPI003397F64F